MGLLVRLKSDDIISRLFHTRRTGSGSRAQGDDWASKPYVQVGLKSGWAT